LSSITPYAYRRSDCSLGAALVLPARDLALAMIGRLINTLATISRAMTITVFCMSYFQYVSVYGQAAAR
jgi:hypothetical protein